MRRAAHIDGPHTAIVAALRRVGCSVLDLRSVGNGAPDLLVGFRGRDRLLEVKSARGRLRASQMAFAAHWRGMPIEVVRSVEDALRLYGAGR